MTVLLLAFTTWLAAPASAQAPWVEVPSRANGTTAWELDLTAPAADGAVFVPGGQAVGRAWTLTVDGTPTASSGEPMRGAAGGSGAAKVDLPPTARHLRLDVRDATPAGAALVRLAPSAEAGLLVTADDAPRRQEGTLDAFAAGFYLFTGLYHLQLFRRRRAMSAYAWFAAVCFGALGVNVFGALARLTALGPAWPHAVMGGVCASGSVVAMLAFGAALVERRLGWTEKAIIALQPLVAGVYAARLVAPVGPVAEQVASVGWLLGLGLFVLGVVRAAREGHPEARLLAAGCAGFGVLLGLGIAAQAGLVSGVPLWLPIPAFALLILAMALSLADRFERAHRELDALRSDLEARVVARTAELADANARLEGFNRDLEQRVQTQVGEIVKNRRLWRYFPRAVVQRLLDRDEEEVRTERARLTVMFTDLTGFTAYSDGADPQEVTRTLNRYLQEMVAVVEAHGGVVDKVMGDGLMAIWGAPEPMAAETQARAAVDAALAMQAKMRTLAEEWEDEGITHPFRVRVGIHQDFVAVGSIGSDALRSFTAIGGGVNLASRLEGQCPPGGILVSTAVASHLSATVRRRGPLARTLKGLRDPVDTWEILVPEEDGRPGLRLADPLVSLG